MKTRLLLRSAQGPAARRHSIKEHANPSGGALSSGPVVRVLLRTASALMLLHFVGHTLAMFQGPSHGPEELAVINAMKSHRFDMMGSSRSYWDFFLGFGFDASLNMLVQTVMLWLLATLAANNPRAARPFLALFVFGWTAEFLLCYRYFFLAPTLFAAVIVVILVFAWANTLRGDSPSAL